MGLAGRAARDGSDSALRGDVDPGFLDRVRLYGVCSAIADAYYGVTAGIEKNRRIGVAALERSFLRNS